MWVIGQRKRHPRLSIALFCNSYQHELAHLERALIEQPAFFITGELDLVSQFVPLSTSFIDHIKHNYRNLIMAEELPNVGHWTAEEAPEAVNRIILQFLSTIEHD